MQCVFHLLTNGSVQPLRLTIFVVRYQTIRVTASPLHNIGNPTHHFVILITKYIAFGYQLGTWYYAQKLRYAQFVVSFKKK